MARLYPFSEGPTTHIRPLQFGEFSDVVCNGKSSELGLDQTIAPIVEALEAPVIFDLSEDGLRLYGPHALMMQSTFTCEKFPRLVSIPPAADIDFYHPVTLPLEAYAAQRTPAAVPCPI